MAEQIKSFFSDRNFRKQINQYRKLKHDFEVNFTGYTGMIKNFSLGKSYFFIKESQKKNYKVTQIIKKDIKNSGVWLDEINTKNIKYFKLSNLKPCRLKTVYNVDINNAYPTTLKIFNLITQETFDKLNQMKKSDKLKAVGMLATNKLIFVFKEGKQVDIYRKSDELTRNSWLALCNYVGEAIDKCRENCNSFLFYWFDGIYFTDLNEAEKMINILSEYKFNSKLEILKDFRITDKGEYLNITYLKPKGSEIEKKHFTLPKSEKITYFN